MSFKCVCSIRSVIVTLRKKKPRMDVQSILADNTLGDNTMYSLGDFFKTMINDTLKAQIPAPSAGIQDSLWRI